jgi:predicted nuclease with TOPRIM domain
LNGGCKKLIKNIAKLDEEISKTKTKISEMNAHLKELERRKTEAENFEIVSMVRDTELSPEQFKEFLALYRQKTENADSGTGKEGKTDET